MTHNQDRAPVAQEGLLQPLQPVDVQVVGRLVQQQHGRLAGKSVGQRGPGLLPAR